MSFLDSSSLSDHSTTSSSFVHLTSLDRTKLAKFESFSAAFSSSKASKLARHDGALSTVDTVPYLHKAYHRQPAPADDGSRLPGYLKSLLLLQTPGGKWQHSPSVLSALSSNVSLLPSPPPGIAPDLWATALALASIRRCPEHIDELKEGYGKGLEWVSKELIVEARDKLPPRDAYYDLDPDLVKTGSWKQSVANSYALGGYQNFLPQSLQNKREAAETSLRKELEEEVRRSEVEEEKKRLASIGVDDGKIRAEYARGERSELSADYERRARFGRMEERRQPLLKLEYKRLAKARDFGELKKRFTADSTMAEDLQRLKVAQKQARAKPSWEGRSKAIESSVAKRLDIGEEAGGGEGGKFAGPSPMAIAAKERATRKMEEKRNRGKRVLTELEKALLAVEMGERGKGGVKYEAAESHEDLKRGLAKAEGDVVSKIMEYEAYVESVKKCLERSIASFKKARVVAIRQKAFDELTAMLGLPQQPRKGYDGWMGRYTKGVVLITVELVESVQKWREAVLAAQGKLGARNEYGDLVDHGDPTPFMWSGRNVLLEIPYNLKFLSKCHDLVAWYGNDFSFERNPFMLAVPLDDRAVTPVKGTRTVMVDGVEVEQESSTLGVKAKKQKAYWDHCQQIFAGGGAWWPSLGGKAFDAPLKRRVRNAEKTLLAEEAVAYGLANPDVGVAKGRVVGNSS